MASDAAVAGGELCRFALREDEANRERCRPFIDLIGLSVECEGVGPALQVGSQEVGSLFDSCLASSAGNLGVEFKVHLPASVVAESLERPPCMKCTTAAGLQRSFLLGRKPGLIRRRGVHRNSGIFRSVNIDSRGKAVRFQLAKLGELESELFQEAYRRNVLRGNQAEHSGE